MFRIFDIIFCFVGVMCNLVHDHVGRWHIMLTSSTILEFITKTCLCDLHPLAPHFYIVILGFTWVYIFFLFLL